MAASRSVINSNGIPDDVRDEVDGLFARRMSTPLFEVSECRANFSLATSREDFPLHYAVFQGDLKAVEQVIDETNMNSLDTHGKYENL